MGFVVIWVKIDSLPRRDNWEVFYGSFTSEGPKAESADDVCHRDKALSQFGDFHRNWNHARIAARQDDLAGHNVIPPHNYPAIQQEGVVPSLNQSTRNVLKHQSLAALDKIRESVAWHFSKPNAIRLAEGSQQPVAINMDYVLVNTAPMRGDFKQVVTRHPNPVIRLTYYALGLFFIRTI